MHTSAGRKADGMVGNRHHGLPPSPVLRTALNPQPPTGER